MRRYALAVAGIVLIGLTGFQSGTPGTEPTGAPASSSVPSPASSAPASSPEASSPTPADPASSSDASASPGAEPAKVTFTDVPKPKGKYEREALHVFQEFYPAWHSSMATGELDPKAVMLAPTLSDEFQQAIKKRKKRDQFVAGEVKIAIQDVTADQQSGKVTICGDLRNATIVTKGKVKPEEQPFTRQVFQLDYIRTADLGSGLRITSWTGEPGDKSVCDS